MPIPISLGAGTASIASEKIGNNDYQQIKVIGGETGSTSVMSVTPEGAVLASIIGIPTVNFSGFGSIITVFKSSSILAVPVGSVITVSQGSIATIIIGGSIAASFTPPANQSVSGTVGASVIGTIPVVQSGTVISSISGTVFSSVSGTVGASVIGLTPVGILNSAGNTQPTSGASGDGSSGVTIMAIAPYVFDGTNFNRIRGSNGIQQVSVQGNVNVNPTTLYAPVASLVSGVTSIITGTSSVLVLPAPAGGQRNYVTQVVVTNAAAVGTFVDIISSGAIIYSGYAAASGGGFSASFPAPLQQPSIVTALFVAPRVQASVIVSASGYTAS